MYAITDSVINDRIFRLITFGSYNRSDERFKRDWPNGIDLSLGNSHCIGVVARTFHYKYKPYDWTASHLDNIICKGDWMHFLLVGDKESQNEPKRTQKVETIRAAGFMHREQFCFEPLMGQSFFGKFTGLRNKIRSYVSKCDENLRCVLLTLKRRTVYSIMTVPMATSNIVCLIHTAVMKTGFLTILPTPV